MELVESKPDKIMRNCRRRDSFEGEALTNLCVSNVFQGARNEFVVVLGSLVKKFDHPKLNELKPLTSDDAEVDFFENIVHIQVRHYWCILYKYHACSCLVE